MAFGTGRSERSRVRRRSYSEAHTSIESLSLFGVISIIGTHYWNVRDAPSAEMIEIDSQAICIKTHKNVEFETCHDLADLGVVVVRSRSLHRPPQPLPVCQRCRRLPEILPRFTVQRGQPGKCVGDREISWPDCRTEFAPIERHGYGGARPRASRIRRAGGRATPIAQRVDEDLALAFGFGHGGVRMRRHQNPLSSPRRA